MSISKTHDMSCLMHGAIQGLIHAFETMARFCCVFVFHVGSQRTHFYKTYSFKQQLILSSLVSRFKSAQSNSL